MARRTGGLMVSAIRQDCDQFSSTSRRPLLPLTRGCKPQTTSPQSVIYAHSNGISRLIALVDTVMPTQESFVDMDLQDLYEQVLAGFSDDPHPQFPTPVPQTKASPSDLDSLYSSYIDESVDPPSKLPRTSSYTIASQRTPISAFPSFTSFVFFN